MPNILEKISPNIYSHPVVGGKSRSCDINVVYLGRVRVPSGSASQPTGRASIVGRAAQENCEGGNCLDRTGLHSTVL